MSLPSLSNLHKDNFASICVLESESSEFFRMLTNWHLCTSVWGGVPILRGMQLNLCSLADGQYKTLAVLRSNISALFWWCFCVQEQAFQRMTGCTSTCTSSYCNTLDTLASEVNSFRPLKLSCRVSSFHQLPSKHHDQAIFRFDSWWRLFSWIVPSLRNLVRLCLLLYIF